MYAILNITYLSILARLNVGQSVSAARFKIFWASESSMGSMLVSQLFSLSMDPTMTHFLLKNAFHLITCMDVAQFSKNAFCVQCSLFDIYLGMM